MPRSIIQLAIVFMSSLILFTSCTFTSTKTKNPEFIEDINLVGKRLDSIISCVNFNFNGKEVTTNKKAASELEISVTNCENVPKEDDKMAALAKIIAKEIKRSLKDPNEYDTYKVLFVTKTESGGVTKRNWVGRLFNSSEL